jgi:DNA-binding transcriptional MerR regulator
MMRPSANADDVEMRPDPRQGAENDRASTGGTADVSSNRPLYSIGAVAAMLESTPATLRSWEERYGVVVPERTEGGRRLYGRDDLEQLRFVKANVDKGFSAADAHRLLRQRLEEPRHPLGIEPPARGAPELLVLLAERDPYGADLSEYFLRTEGFIVELALSAEEAERAYSQRRPALAIIELLISGGAGADLCYRLKQLAPVPVLAISSLDACEQALAAGADAFLQKPLDPLLLVSAVKDLLGQSALTRGSAR